MPDENEISDAVEAALHAAGYDVYGEEDARSERSVHRIHIDDWGADEYALVVVPAAAIEAVGDAIREVQP